MNMKYTNKIKRLMPFKITVLILIILRIVKIITVIKMMKNKIRDVFIGMCSLGSYVWFLYFILNTKHYHIIDSLEAIITVLLMCGIGYFILYRYNGVKIHKNLRIFYSLILIIIGTLDCAIDMTFIGSGDFSNTIVYAAILCDVFYFIFGNVLLFYFD